MRKITKVWLQAAGEDCLMAQKAMEIELYRQVCFHSQQCVEKGMKAVMEKHNWETKGKKLLDLYGQVISDY